MKVSVIFLFFIILLTGCGTSSSSESPTNSNSTSQTPPTASAQPFNIQGPWQFALTANPNLGVYRVINVNLSQTGGSISASAQSAAIVQIINSAVTFQDDCGNSNSGYGQDSVNGNVGAATLVNQSDISSLSLTFTVTSGNESEQIVVTGEVTDPNGFIANGTYTVTGSCGHTDTGSVLGTAISASPTAGLSGDYFGNFGGYNPYMQEFSLSPLQPAFTVCANQPYAISAPASEVGGEFFISQTTAFPSTTFIQDLYLSVDSLDWTTIFGTTLYPFPNTPAYYIQEGSYPASVFYASASSC